MKKFINHIDHVTWVSHAQNIERNVAELEAVTGGSLRRLQRDDIGIVAYVDWSAGLEVIAPLEHRTAFNASFHDWLESRGEGVMAIIFGVEDLEQRKAVLEAGGLAVGPLMYSQHSRLVLREREVKKTIIGSSIFLSQIDYADDVIQFVDVDE